MINYTATYTDQYQITMALAYFRHSNHNKKAVFDYFFRKNPFSGGYTVFAGLEDVLDILENLHFDKEDISYLDRLGFPADFLEYLRNFEFRGSVFSSKEGDIIFPTRPVLQVEGTLLEAQLVETLLLNILNYQSLIATKASRMEEVVGEGKLVDFGLRRAHGPGGYLASKAAAIGGFQATSNVKSAKDFNIEVSGTMAHSFVQSYDQELDAFRDFAEARPKDCVLLVDTYDTLRSGLPNAIKVGKEMEEKNERLLGIRLDSGDLSYLGKESRKMLDDAGLHYVKIAASNQLDEHVIRSLNAQDSKIDLFGVGTELITGQPDAKLDGVYKLAFANGKPRLKLSETKEKISLPHKKQVYRLINDEEEWIGADVVSIRGENNLSVMNHPHEQEKTLDLRSLKKEALLQNVMKDGKRTIAKQSIKEISNFRRERLSRLPAEYKRFENPHIYKVGLSEQLTDERDQLIDNYRKK